MYFLSFFGPMGFGVDEMEKNKEQHFGRLSGGKIVGTIEDQRETWLLWIYLNICKNDGEYLQQCLSSRDKTSSLEYFAPHEMMILHIVLFCFCLMHLIHYKKSYILTLAILNLEVEKSCNQMCLCPNPGFPEWDTPGAAFSSVLCISDKCVTTHVSPAG